MTVESIIDLVNQEQEVNADSMDMNSARVLSNPYINDDYTNEYNLRNVNQPKLASRIGLFVYRSSNFDSNHKVSVSLYELNYGFFKSAGFKVKFQEKKSARACFRIFRRRFCRTLFTYWTKKEASDMVIEIDYFKGFTQFTDFGLTPETYLQSIVSITKIGLKLQ